jgi:hypothetical protein
MDHRFPFWVDRRYLPLLLPLGFRGSKDGVTITDAGGFNVTFGVFSLRTRMDNIDEAHVTRDYRWWTAVGARRSFVDDGLTFGTNHTAGVCVHFRERVSSALSRKGHSALTVTVEDLDGLVEALTR